MGGFVVGAEPQHQVADASRGDRAMTCGPHAQTMRCGRCGCPESAELRTVFHDIGNHLATFSTILDTVDDNVIPEAYQRYVAMMRTQTTRMLTLLQDAVEHARQPELVEVCALIEEIVSVANSKRLATVTMYPGAPQWLRTRPAALWRAVANVVDNAVRAAGAAGRVEVWVRAEAAGIVVEVTDDGPGFGAAPPGTASLGLGIATSLTRQCGGRLEVETAHPHGVRVRLEFGDLAPADLDPGDLDSGDLGQEVPSCARPARSGRFAGTGGQINRS